MALINFSGIASGIDSSALIQALIDQQTKARITPLEDKISAFQETNSSLKQLKELLGKLKSAASTFNTLSGSGVVKYGASTDETVLTATASNSASNGTYDVTVTQLAKNATYAFKSTAGTYNSADQAIGSSISGTGNVQVTVGTGSDQEVVTVNVTNSTTLNQFVTSYNNSASKSVASVINVGTSASPDYRVTINTNNEGTQKGSIAVSVSSQITTASAFNNNTSSAAQDATLSIEGIGAGAGDTITRSSNSISDVIPGVTLNLASIGSASISVKDDAASSSSNMQEFVDAYNNLVEFISENDVITRENSEQGANNIFGPLASTSLDENILFNLRSAMTASGTSGRSINILADLGISTERDGKLKFNVDTFEDAISEDAEAVRIITQALGDTVSNTGGTIDQFTRFGGLLDSGIDSNNVQVTSLERQIENVQDQLDAYKASLTGQYSHLEGLIGRLNSQQNALSAVLPK